MTGQSKPWARQVAASAFMMAAFANAHAVPGYQEIHVVDGRNGDVRGIGGGVWREPARGQNCGGQRGNFGRQVYQGKILNYAQARACGCGVSSAGLVDNQL